MRCFLCAFFLCCSITAQNRSSIHQASQTGNGSFYVHGIVYHYVAGTDYTVVVAAHSAINRKFVAVKVRVYNGGRESVTLKPEEVTVEDAVASRALAMIPGAELAKKMRRPYNWARFAAGPDTGDVTNITAPADAASAQWLEMMRAMAAKANASGTPMLPGSQGVLYTDTPGALQAPQPRQPLECDTVCRLRNREAANPDVLAQLQRQNSPDYVEQSAFLANTISPQSDADGVLFFPMPKLTRSASPATNGKKAGLVRITVPVGEEKFQFLLVVD